MPRAARRTARSPSWCTEQALRHKGNVTAGALAIRPFCLAHNIPLVPAKAGTQIINAQQEALDSRFRGNERIIVESRYVSSITGLRRTPISGTATSTTSPGLSQTGGLRCTPAPVGVPVQIRSPGLSVAKVLM